MSEISLDSGKPIKPPSFPSGIKSQNSAGHQSTLVLTISQESFCSLSLINGDSDYLWVLSVYPSHWECCSCKFFFYSKLSWTHCSNQRYENERLKTLHDTISIKDASRSNEQKQSINETSPEIIRSGQKVKRNWHIHSNVKLSSNSSVDHMVLVPSIHHKPSWSLPTNSNIRIPLDKGPIGLRSIFHYAHYISMPHVSFDHVLAYNEQTKHHNVIHDSPDQISEVIFPNMSDSCHSSHYLSQPCSQLPLTCIG